MAATFAAGFGVAGLVDVGLATALAVVDLGVGFAVGFAAGFAAGLAAALAVVDLGAGFTAGFTAGFADGFAAALAVGFAAALAVGFGVAAFEADRFGALRTTTYSDVPMLRRSVKAKGATARVRAFFAALPADTSRKDAIAAAVNAGFAYCTCRTQYQVWKNA